MRTFTAPKSSTINQVWYNAETKVMSVRFKNENGYIFLGVPQTKFKSFKQAKSKGRYFTKQIRNNYTFQRDVFASR